MQGEILRAFRNSRQKILETRAQGFGEAISKPGQEAEARKDVGELASGGREATSPSRDIALCYLRLVNLDSELIDRLSRYEAGLWRQAVQTLFALQTLKRR